MEEVKRATEGPRPTETKRLQRRGEAEAARTQSVWRDAIPAERLPEHASAASTRR